MEQYRTNQFIHINDKFLLIENHFMVLSNNSPNKKMFKLNSHLNLLKRPILKKYNKEIIDKDKLNIKNPLDQIGNDDLIFNNDKLITNIKFDAFEELSHKDSNEDIHDIDNNKVTRKSTTPIREVRNKSNKINLHSIDVSKNTDHDSKNNANHDHFEIDSLKFQKKNKHNKEKEKINSTKNIKNNKNLITYNNNRLKNINQFINKPNDNNSVNQKNLLMSPSSSKSPSKIGYKHPVSGLIKLKLNSNMDRSNDSISLNSGSRMGFKHCKRGKSMPNFFKNKSNVHFPNKSVIKNKDKLHSELQKIFGEKISLYDDIYNIMTDTDKKNCINFLLEAIKGMFNINKNIQIKNESIKEINETKEKQIKDDKKEIKELKKDINKLNKIIKINIQMNQKLSQNIDKLKMQLEKEKNKNKELNSKGKSSDKNLLNARVKKDLNEINLTSAKRNRFISQDKYRNADVFINMKKLINSNKNKEKNKNNSSQKKNDINLKSIEIEDINNNNNKNDNKNEIIKDIKEEKSIDTNLQLNSDDYQNKNNNIENNNIITNRNNENKINSQQTI